MPIVGLAARLGFEPRLTESESVVLPLHHQAARRDKRVKNLSRNPCLSTLFHYLAAKRPVSYQFHMATILTFILVGSLLMLLETLIPGGIVGLFGFILVCIGVYLAFAASGWTGIGVLLGTAVLLLGGGTLWWRYLPRCSWAKGLRLAESATGWEGSPLLDLVGESGVARTNLRPTGVAIIGGLRYDVVSQGDFIPKGEAVTVVDASGNRVIVTTSPHQSNRESS